MMKKVAKCFVIGNLRSPLLEMIGKRKFALTLFNKGSKRRPQDEEKTTRREREDSNHAARARDLALNKRNGKMQMNNRNISLLSE